MKTTAHLKTTGGSQVSKSESKPKGNILKSVFLTPNGEPSADPSFLPRHWSFLLIHVISREICEIRRLRNLGRPHTLAVSLRGFPLPLTDTFIVLTLRFSPLQQRKRNSIAAPFDNWEVLEILPGRQTVFPHVSPPPPGTNGQDRSGH